MHLAVGKMYQFDGKNAQADREYSVQAEVLYF